MARRRNKGLPPSSNIKRAIRAGRAASFRCARSYLLSSPDSIAEASASA